MDFKIIENLLVNNEIANFLTQYIKRDLLIDCQNDCNLLAIYEL